MKDAILLVEKGVRYRLGALRASKFVLEAFRGFVVTSSMMTNHASRPLAVGQV